MKKKIFTLVICFVLIIATVFTTLHISNVYDFRKELIGVIERDSVNFSNYSYEFPATFNRFIDIIELDNYILSVCTVKENHTNEDIIFVAFIKKTKPGYLLEELWCIDKEIYNDKEYMNPNSDLAISYTFNNLIKLSKGTFFASFLKTKDVSEREEEFSYCDYSIKAFGKSIDVTLKYRVSKNVEYPIQVSYLDDVDYKNNTQFISCFIDENNIMYVATHKTRDGYEPEVYTGAYSPIPLCKNVQEFRKYYGFAKISEKKLESSKVDELYNRLLEATEFSGYSWHIDEAYVSLGCSNSFCFPNPKNPTGSYGGTSLDNTTNISEIFDLINEYLDDKSAEFKNPF